MNKFSKSLIGGLAIIMAGTGVAYALDNGGPIDTAIKNKIIGEQANGYIGFVKPATPDQLDLQRSVNEVNAVRKKVYTDIVSKAGGTIDQVATLQAMRQIQKSDNGTYIKDLSGKWCAKSSSTVATQGADGTISISCQ